MGDIIGNMMPNLPAEKRAELNKGSARESAPPPAAVVETTPQPGSTPPATAAEPSKEKTAAADPTLSTFLPPEAGIQDNKKPTESQPSIEQLSEDDKKLPEDVKGKKGQERWHKITSTADAAIAEVTRLRAENETLKTAPKVDEDTKAYITKIEGRLSEMSAAFERVSLLDHPAIRTQFIAPREAELNAASNLLKEVDIDPAILQRALAATGKARIEALDELNASITSPTVQMKIVDHVAKIEHFDQQLANAMTDVKGTHERLASEDRVRRHQATQQDLKRTNELYDSAIDYLRDQGFEYLKKNGNPKFDALVDQIVEEGRTLLTKTENMEQIAVAAVGLPLAIRFRNAWLTTAQQLKAAHAEIAEMKNADPGLNGGSSSAAGDITTVPAITPQRGAVEIAMENIRGSRG